MVTPNLILATNFTFYSADDASAVGKLIETEERETGSVAFRVFYHYGQAMGLLLVCLVAFFLTAQYSVMIATDFWLSAWSEAGARLINVTQVDMHVVLVLYRLSVYSIIMVMP